MAEALNHDKLKRVKVKYMAFSSFKVNANFMEI
jgi:hypothetical protein